MGNIHYSENLSLWNLTAWLWNSESFYFSILFNVFKFSVLYYIQWSICLSPTFLFISTYQSLYYLLLYCTCILSTYLPTYHHYHMSLAVWSLDLYPICIVVDIEDERVPFRYTRKYISILNSVFTIEFPGRVLFI